MFGTLLGGLPSPADVAADDGTAVEAVEAAIRAQEAAGLEPVTDGRLGTRSSLDAWRAAAALTNRAVKQSLTGPYSRTRDLGSSVKARERAAMAAAEQLREDVIALAGAGCPLVEIEETQAHRIGDDEAERRIFASAHRRLAGGLTGAHLSLSIVGGSAWDAGAANILDLPYHSLAVDLIAGPDNWNLVVRAPADRGIVAGALSPHLGSDDSPELLLWAANYAASTGGRGHARVGLAIAGSLAHLTWEQALVKLDRLGRAVRIASLPPGDELANAVDPRSINIRSAAHGRPMPNRPPARRVRPRSRP